jgi:phosphatidylglycerophosphatase A
MTARRRLARIIASAGGIGLIPGPAGTYASAAAVATGATLMQAGPLALPVAASLATAAGLFATAASGSATEDPGWIVIDEVAGQWLAMAALPSRNPRGLLAAFILFRLFDVTKLGPVGTLDRRHDAVGVMGDDIVAGALAGAVLWLTAGWWR